MTQNNIQFIRVPTPHSLITIRAVIHAGATHETESEIGAAHYLEHMFFKGTRTKDVPTLMREMAKIGSWNAYTSRGRTVFHMKTLPADLPRATELLAELLFDPAMPEEEFQKERTTLVVKYAEMNVVCHYNPTS